VYKNGRINTINSYKQLTCYIRVCQYISQHNCTLGFCGQPHYCIWPYHMAVRFQPSSSHKVSAKLLLYWSRSMSGKSTQMWPCQLSVYECEQQQTVSHMVDICQLTKWDGKLQSLHSADSDALKLSYDICCCD